MPDGEGITASGFLSELRGTIAPLVIVGGIIFAAGSSYFAIQSLGVRMEALDGKLAKRDEAAAVRDERLAVSIQTIPLQADKLRQLEAAQDRFNTRIEQAIEQGRARNSAQDAAINEATATARLIKADVDRLIVDVRTILEAANSPLRAPRRP